MDIGLLLMSVYKPDSGIKFIYDLHESILGGDGVITFEMEQHKRHQSRLYRRMADSKKFPKAVYFIIPNEFCERFCFYGIKNLLNLYLQNGFGLSRHLAKSQVHMFNGLVYAFPLAGAAISDSFLGKFYTIVYLSLVYLVGNVLLSLFATNGLVGEYGKFPIWACVLPLMLIAVGTGGIKPCVSSHGGDQFTSSQSELLDRFFALFYLSINTGALLAQYLTPYLKDKVQCFGAHCYVLAFGVPTVLFAIALVVFIAGYRFYNIVPPTREFLPLKALKLSWLALSRRVKATPQERLEVGHWLQFAKGEYTEEFIEETRLLGKVIVMCIPIIFFWVLYDQNGTEWQNQYEMMNHEFLGLFSLPTEASSLINSVLIILFVPMLSYYVYPFLERRNIHVPVLTRMALGFFLTIIAFVVSIVLQYIVEANAASLVVEGNVAVACPDCINGAWQLPQWIILSLGEAMLSPTGIQFAYTQVGPQMKASSTSVWLLTTACGNYIVMGLEYGIGELYAPTRQWIYTAISTGFFIIFMLLAKFWFISKEDEDLPKVNINEDKPVF